MKEVDASGSRIRGKCLEELSGKMPNRKLGTIRKQIPGTPARQLISMSRVGSMGDIGCAEAKEVGQTLDIVGTAKNISLANRP
jgi:hypothetical protein